MKEKGLLFDTQVEYGSKEHFFHFLWGYLLPSISILTNQRKAHEVVYYVETSGPIMDEVMTEILNLLNIRCSILSKNDFASLQDKEIVPRWDLYLLHNYILDIEKGDFTHISEFQKSTLLLNILSEKNFEKTFRETILETRNCILSAVQKTETYTTILQENRNQILVIKRSESPDFYSQTGSAEIKGYGMDRRGLVDIDAFIKTTENSQPCIVAYEPGRHSMVHQISTLHVSKGLIGIKGAEFANLLWMKEQSKVLLIRPASMKTPPVQNTLAALMNLYFTEIVSEEEKYPSLLKLNIEKNLS